MKTIIKKTVTICCKSCDGMGRKSDNFFNVVTFGAGLLLGVKDRCEICNGKGYKYVTHTEVIYNDDSGEK